MAALPEFPEKNFLEMLLLILRNHRRPLDPFTPQVLMAIFWEETLFNNSRQVVSGGGFGRGVGFGQVEKQELPKVSTQEALLKGYFVPGMTKTTTTLPDDTSVQVASCMLLHLFHQSKSNTREGKVAFAYRGYSGSRQAIIDRWVDCEKRLLSLPFSEFKIVNFPEPLANLEERIMEALQPARAFDPKRKVTVTAADGSKKLVRFRDTLFPRFWFMPESVKQQLPSFAASESLLMKGSKGTQVSLLQTLLNGVTAAAKPLKPDGVFGPLTDSAVRAFQAASALAKIDGIVGPVTRRTLVG